jgi:hypothetical protein
MRHSIITFNDKMQAGYRYVLSIPADPGFNSQFRPDLTPQQMLELGVFLASIALTPDIFKFTSILP